MVGRAVGGGEAVSDGDGLGGDEGIGMGVEVGSRAVEVEVTDARAMGGSPAVVGPRAEGVSVAGVHAAKSHASIRTGTVISWGTLIVRPRFRRIFPICGTRHASRMACYVLRPTYMSITSRNIVAAEGTGLGSSMMAVMVP